LVLRRPARYPPHKTDNAAVRRARDG